MKMKRLIYFTLTVILLFTLSFSSLAAHYISDLPNYVGYSGGAFFEVVDANLGTVTCVFPIEFKNGYFGFSCSSNGVVTNIVNLTNSTINGYVITRNGTTYNCRVTRFGTVEYQRSYSTGGTYYTSLSPDILSMTNTNVSFITDDREYYNENYFDSTKFFIAISSIETLLLIFLLASNLFRRGAR